MAYITASGTKVFFCETPSATVDTVSEYKALTYVEVGGVTNLGRFGDVRNLVQLEVLGDGRVRNLGGARNAGTLEFTCAFDALDAGQIAMMDGSETNFEFPVKVVIPDAQSASYTDSEFYMKVMVTSAAVEAGTNSTVVTITFTCPINSAVYKDLTHLAA